MAALVDDELLWLTEKLVEGLDRSLSQISEAPD
jgi:hypothetical protein